MRAGVWRNRDFVRLWAAATASTFGTDVTAIAFPFVAILTLDATPWQIGLLQIAHVLPAFLTGLFAGAFVDRLQRRSLMIACDLFRALLLISVPLAALIDRLTFGHLLIVAGLASVADALFHVADRSFLPSVLAREDLLDGNRMLTAGQTFSEASGFATGGWLVQVLTAPGALAIDAASFVVSALLLRRIEHVESPRTGRESNEPLLGEMRAGLTFLVRDALLRPLAGSRLLLSLGMGIVGTVYMLYVNQEVGFSPGVLGVIFATGGLWSLLGSLTVTRLGGTIGIGPLMIASLIATGASQTLTAVVSAATVLGVVLLLMQQSGDLAWTGYEIVSVSVRQSCTPEALLGRINGGFHVLETGGALAGALIGGWLGSALGLRATILIGACCGLAAAVPLALSPIRRLTSLPSIDQSSPSRT